MASPPRPRVQRSDYRPSAPQEQFIVPLMREQIERMLAMHPARPGGTALDAGCGRQPFRNALEELGYAYASLDALQNAEGSVDHVAPLDSALPPALTAAGPFDVVLCTEVLEHVADWTTAFANLAQLTRPGGVVLLTCPHFYQLHETPYDYWRPTPHAIAYHAERGGFDIVEQTNAGDGWDVLGTALANCQCLPRQPGLSFWVAAKFASLCKKVVFRALVAGRLQTRVALHGPLYLSNVAVLQRRNS